jgi:hypothetical protein
MTTETTEQPTAEATAEPTEVVPRDGRWGVFSLMGHKVIAGRASRDELLGGGTVLVLTPGPDGISLAKARTFNPSTSLYLAEWCSRQEVLDFLYPPISDRYELTASPDSDEEYGIARDSEDEAPF